MKRRLALHAAALFGLSLLPRLALWERARPHPERFVKPDSVEYLQLAGDLAEKHAFVDAAGGPAFRRTPGYPLFLAAAARVAGNGVSRLVLVQLLVAGLTPIALYGLCLAAGLGEAAALGAGAAWALDLNDALHSVILSTEATFCLALAAGVLLLWAVRRGKDRAWAGASGLSLAAASFIRPIGLYLPLTLAPWLWRRGRGTVLLFLAFAYALPGAWVLRNRVELGRWEFCSISEYNLLYWRAAGVEALRTGRSIDQINARWRQDLSRRFAGRGPSEADEASYDIERALPIVRAHPELGLRLMATGAVKTMGGHGMDLLSDTVFGPTPAPPAGDLTRLAGSGTRWLLSQRPALRAPLVGYLAFLAALYLAALIGAVRLWRRGPRDLLALLGWGAFYFLFLSSGAESYYRFRLPIMVFLLPLAAAAYGALPASPCKPVK